MPGPFWSTCLEAPASAAGHYGAKQADNYNDQLLQIDHPHVIGFPESRAEDSLGFTKVAPFGRLVNLSLGRGTVLLVANGCSSRCRVVPRGLPPPPGFGPGACGRCSADAT